MALRACVLYIKIGEEHHKALAAAIPCRIAVIWVERS